MTVKCNYCEEVFGENEIILNEEEDEICPYCHTQGCIEDYPETVQDIEKIWGKIPKPYGYDIILDPDSCAVIAICKKCKHWVGQYQLGYGWYFSSAVDFGNTEKGLCDICAEEK